jgi:agmatinase
MALAPRLIGIPYDASSSFLRGSAGAPPLVREALYSPARSLWTEGLRDLGAEGGLVDAGDLALPATGEARARIEAAIRLVAEAGGAPIAIGGDHSISYPVIRSLALVHGPLSILHVDAHPDLYDVFDGDRYSHACPFARVLEEGHARSLTQVGIRAGNAEQRAQANRFGVEAIDMRAWAAGERPVLRGPLYVSIDLDGIDPAFAPGVAHPEPGGLTVREVLGLIQSAPAPIVGADVVELCPERDPLGLTAVVAAKIVKEIAGRILGGDVSLSG